MLPLIAKDAVMDEVVIADTMATFVSPTVESQLSEIWLDGNAQTFIKGIADVFVAARSIDSALGSYVGNVNTDPLKAATGN